MSYKRSLYEQQNYELISEFRIVHPDIKCQIKELYKSSFYVSCLWELSGEPFQRLCTTCLKSIRGMGGLPPQALWRLLEPLSGTHVKGTIIGEFIGFSKLLLASPKMSIQHLAHHFLSSYNSVSGRNLVLALCEMGGISHSIVTRTWKHLIMRYKP